MAAVSGLQAMAAVASAAAAQLSSSGNGVAASPRVEFAPPRWWSCERSAALRQRTAVTTTCQAAAASKEVPDMGKRVLMNYLLLGAVTLPTVGMIGPYLYFLVPPGAGTAGAGLTAKDALGNDIVEVEWLQTHPPGDRTLSQGLKGDPTYLVVENDGKLAGYGINGVCTHLGCVVPYNTAEKKFICPCHGSQYNNQGKVVRGPAPLSLALARVNITEGAVVFAPWEDTDFRTGEKPWWA